MSKNLSPELQALVAAKEANAPVPKYFLGDKQVKVMRVRVPLNLDKSGSGYRWYEITDQLIAMHRVTDIRREPPLSADDNFA